MMNNKLSVTALVPMKGNSERVFKKNIRDFNGKPLFSYVLEILQASSEVVEIIVNTDSVAIADIVQKEYRKVVIHERPKELCGAEVPMNEIIAYDLDYSTGKFFLQTHVTNPLLSLQTLKDAIYKYFSNTNMYDSLFSVTPYYKRFWSTTRIPINHDPSKLINTQDLNEIYEENSCIYIFSRESFYNAGKNRIGKKPYLYKMKPIESFDIDTNYDFVLSELVYRNLNLFID